MRSTLRHFIGAITLAGVIAGPATGQTMIYLNKDRPLRQPDNYQRPLSYRDARSGVVFYVESDGRHVSAIDATGKVLWTRYPFFDAKLLPYREDNPPIVYVGATSQRLAKVLKGNFLSIAFSTTQFGVMNMTNGDFEWMGQD